MICEAHCELLLKSLFIVIISKNCIHIYAHHIVVKSCYMTSLLFISQICVYCNHVRRGPAGSCEGFGRGGWETESSAESRERWSWDRGEDWSIRQLKTSGRRREQIQTEETRSREALWLLCTPSQTCGTAAGIPRLAISGLRRPRKHRQHCWSSAFWGTAED